MELNNLLRYVDEHLNDNVNLSQLGELTGYSPWHIDKKFKQFTGEPFASYVRKRRLINAANEMSKNANLFEVALNNGFETAAGFYKAFVKQFNCTPSEYKRRSKLFSFVNGLASYEAHTDEQKAGNEMLTNMFLTAKEKFTNDDKNRCIPMIKKIIDFSKTSRSYGILALEERLERERQPAILVAGINLITDGTDPKWVEKILLNLLVSNGYTGYELLEAMIAAQGILLIQEGVHPHLICVALTSMLGSDYFQLVGNKYLEFQYAQDKKKKYKELVESFTNQQGIPESEEFEKLIKSFNNEHFHSFLKNAVKGSYQLSYALLICGHETVNAVLSQLSVTLGASIIEDMRSETYNKSYCLQCQREMIEAWKMIKP
jgi:AraC-like DNA-binding protein